MGDMGLSICEEKYGKKMKTGKSIAKRPAAIRKGSFHLV